MFDLDILNCLKEIREGIYSGKIAEGSMRLQRVLLIAKDKSLRAEIMLDLIFISIMIGDLSDARAQWEVFQSGKFETTVRIEAYEAFFLIFDRAHVRHASARIGKCIQTDPDNFEFYMLRAVVYSDLQMHHHALPDIERALLLSPNNILILSVYAEVLMYLEENEKAIEVNKQVLDGCPAIRRCLINLGMLYLDSNRLEEAYSLFSCFIAYDPLNWFAWTCMGDIYLSVGKHLFQSLSAYAAAIIAGTDVEQTYVNLARGLFAIGRCRRAIEVFNWYEKDKHWQKNALSTVRYLKAVVDVMNHPEIVRDETAFAELLKPLKQRTDKGFKLLLRILADLSSLDACDTTKEVYRIHTSCFINISKYMAMCNTRIINTDEALVLGNLVRVLIWNGMTFEAQAIMSMLHKADDAIVQDMIDLLTSELYDYSDKAVHAGVDMQQLHEMLFHTSATARLCDASDSIFDQDTDDAMRWRRLLAQNMTASGTSDICRLFFDVPFTKAAENLEKRIAERPLSSDEFKALWQDCKAYALNMPLTERPKTQETVTDVDTLLKSFKKDYDEWSQKLAPTREEDEFGSLLSSMLNPCNDAAEAMESFAANDDVTRTYAASSPLPQSDPMPFTLDGTAFRNMAARPSYFVLREKTAAGLFETCVDPFVRRTFRSQSDKPLSDASYLSFAQSQKEWLKKAFLIAHGEDRLNHLSKDVSQLETLNAMIGQTEGRNPFLQLISSGAQENENRFLKPSAPISVPTLCVHQKAQTPIKGARVLNTIVTGGLLTRVDLIEQFFNRAVYALQMWKQNNDVQELSIFFEDPHFVFRKFSAFDHNIEAQWLRDERERRCKEKASSLEDTIETPQALAEEVQTAEEWFWKEVKAYRIMEFERFNRGTRLDGFIDQFMNWAQYHADKIYARVASLEHMSREQKSSEQFVMMWHLQDLLKQYPYLSRLHLLLSKAYLRLGENENAIESIERGLIWEERLYRDVGWKPVRGEDHFDHTILSVDSPTEVEEISSLLWKEHIVFLSHNEDSMYHYAPYDSDYPIRTRRMPRFDMLMPVAYNDKGGAYDFYRLFRQLMLENPELQAAFLRSMTIDGVYSLRDYLNQVLIEMDAPRRFPLRRQIAEFLYQLYPQENPGKLARFYCDNVQPINGFPMASFAFFMGTAEDIYDANAQSALTLGCTLYDMGFMDAAVEFLNIAVQQEKPTPMVYLTLGCVNIEMERYEDALTYLKTGLKLDPQSDRFYYNMSLAYFELGDIDESERCVRKGLELASFQLDLDMQLVRIYIVRGRFDEALPLVQYVHQEDSAMFLSAILTPEFSKLRKLNAVRDLIASCGLSLHLIDLLEECETDMTPEEMKIDINTGKKKDRLAWLKMSLKDDNDFYDDKTLLESAMDNQSTDNQSPDNQSPDNQSTDNQSTDDESPDDESPDDESPQS